MNLKVLSIFIVLIIVNIHTAQGWTVLARVLETGLHFLGLITDVSKQTLESGAKTHCGIAIGQTCTVRVYNELSGGAILNAGCKSADDTIDARDIPPGEQLSFKFGPKGSLEAFVVTKFWCTISIPGMGGSVTFDSWNGDGPRYDNHWYVRDRGVYLKTDPSEEKYDNTLFYEWAIGDANNVRLRSSSYRLWESKDENNNPTGQSMVDWVQNDGCKNVPKEWDDRASAVTVCDWDCVVLYQWENCRGETSRREAEGAGCTHFYLTYFDDRTSAVGGCNKENHDKPLIPLAQARSLRYLGASRNITYK